MKPDIEVAKDDALHRAQVEALQAIAAKETDETRKTALSWSVETLESEANPILLKPAELRAYAGVYGIRKISAEGDGLFYQREGQPRFKLIPVGKDVFRGEFMDDWRLRFTRDAGGKVVEMTALDPSGPIFSEKRAS